MLRRAEHSGQIGAILRLLPLLVQSQYHTRILQINTHIDGDKVTDLSLSPVAQQERRRACNGRRLFNP
jgi:hypothetical protein